MSKESDTWECELEVKEPDISESAGKRREFLETVEDAICRDRNISYGEPEDTFKIIADYWNTYLQNRCDRSQPLDPINVADMMILFKMGRNTAGGSRDTYRDIAGYAGCTASMDIGEDE